MANFQKLQAQNKLLDEAQIFYTKYTDSCKRYNELLQGKHHSFNFIFIYFHFSKLCFLSHPSKSYFTEPILTQSLQQKEARDKLVLNMNSLLLPFISDLFGVRY